MSDSETALLADELPAAPDHPTAPAPQGRQNEQSNLDATLNLFKTYIDEKLATLKEDIVEGASTSTSAAKKLKETEVTFKFEGNKQQYKFNCSLEDQVALAQRALKRKRNSQLSEAVDELEKRIKKRNKLIKLICLVNEYLSDELASGSEDEKRIKKAEQSALRKKNLKQKQQTAPRNYRNTGQRQSFSTSTCTNSAALATPNRYPTSRSNYTGARTTDICFTCGLQGY
jgi:hypothetical protein